MHSDYDEKSDVKYKDAKKMAQRRMYFIGKKVVKTAIFGAIGEASNLTKSKQSSYLHKQNILALVLVSE